jgi:hypothetical protein
MVVVCKPILVFSFDFGQAEQYSDHLWLSFSLALAKPNNSTFETRETVNVTP